MVAPLPQDQRAFKREFDQNRLAALRGDTLVFPEEDEQATYEPAGGGLPDLTPRVFARDSEDGLLAQLASSPPAFQASFAQAADPADFSFMQQQARMAEGIGSPELLSPEAAALPDPEYSTDDNVVTYGESVAALSAQAREAPTLEGAGGFRSAIQSKSKEAVDAAGKKLEEWAKEKTNRWIAKGIGNGGNAVDSVGGVGFIVFTVTYLYIMARGFVSVLVPESSKETDSVEGYAVKKGLHILFPPYRPLQEPGDFLWFIAAAIITGIIVTLVLFALHTIMTVTILPAFLPGAATSSL